MNFRLYTRAPHPIMVHLLVPGALFLAMGAMWWRIEHPPLSQTDRRIKRALSQASWVQISGTGFWKDATGLSEEQGFLVKDRTDLDELLTTLRCTDQVKLRTPTISCGSGSGTLFITILTRDSRAQRNTSLSLAYWRDMEDSQTCYVALSDATLGQHPTQVQARFAPRFEALIARLSSRAAALGTLQRVNPPSYMSIYPSLTPTEDKKAP